jgi:hypothetical protein
MGAKESIQESGVERREAVFTDDKKVSAIIRVRISEPGAPAWRKFSRDASHPYRRTCRSARKSGRMDHILAVER